MRPYITQAYPTIRRDVGRVIMFRQPILTEYIIGENFSDEFLLHEPDNGKYLNLLISMDASIDCLRDPLLILTIPHPDKGITSVAVNYYECVEYKFIRGGSIGDIVRFLYVRDPTPPKLDSDLRTFLCTYYNSRGTKENFT